MFHVVLLRLNNICTGYSGWKDANHLKLSWIAFLKQSDFHEMQIKVTQHVSLALIHIFLLPMWYIRQTKSLKNGRKTGTLWNAWGVKGCQSAASTLT